MVSYPLIQDFDSSDDCINTDPSWVLAIIRFRYPLTYSRTGTGSFSSIFADAVATRGDTLVISNGCQQVQVSQSKRSPLTQMQASLLPNDKYNLLSAILPDDWIFAWITNSEDEAKKVIQAIKQKKAANWFLSGLKFIGRVNSLRKSLIQSPSGMRSVHYNLSATGFNEFQSMLYYEPALAEKIQTLGQFWARIVADFNKLINHETGGILGQNAILFFLNTLLGSGVPKNFGLPDTDVALQQTAGDDAPYSYIVPSKVGELIGRNNPTKEGGILAVADLLDVVYGVQKYTGSSYASPAYSVNTNTKGFLFQPDNTQITDRRRFTGTDLEGTFTPVQPQFTNKSVWAVLNSFLNPAMNEMYTCLRANPKGDIVPTLVVRQLPFSTSLAPTSIATTRYTELPRWELDPILVQKADIGRSNALRMNFVHVYGDPGQIRSPDVGYTEQIVRYPPVRDDLDISRSGLHMYAMTVPAALKEITGGGPRKWMDLLQDIIIGQQLTLTGVVELVGIQAPICPGDNLEWDNTLYHIESVVHNAGISPSGHKHFSTILSLSHGMNPDEDGIGESNELDLYAGMDEKSMRDLEPGITVEGDENEKVDEAQSSPPPSPLAPNPDDDPTKLF